MSQQYKFIISGGGTGGHIFPAISIANALKERFPRANILFVGALGRMEMDRVPVAGYSIKGLPVKGFDRKNMLRNFRVAIDLVRSFVLARRIVRKFMPDVVIGVGGYASFPTLIAATTAGIPTLIQEQNSYAGIANKILSKKVSTICVAYQGMDKFFPHRKIVLTGNPVRQDLLLQPKTKEAYQFFNFDPHKQTILILGGSLGARTINQSIVTHLQLLTESDVQVIWQTGKLYIAQAQQAIKQYDLPHIHVTDFIARMDFAYSIADLVISRAGASSISELCLLGKPVILVPSPNVAEDHQTKNAQALVAQNAAVMVEDKDAEKYLLPKALSLIKSKDSLQQLSKNIATLAKKNSADNIVEEIIKLLVASRKKRKQASYKMNNINKI